MSMYMKKGATGSGVYTHSGRSTPTSTMGLRSETSSGRSTPVGMYIYIFVCMYTVYIYINVHTTP